MSNQTKYSSKLRNARVLVIGGSSGLGYGVAEGCTEHGALVTISSSNASRVQAAISKLQRAYPTYTSNVHGLTVDLSNPQTLESELEKLFKETAERMPGKQIDHVVYTAGDPLPIIPINEISMDKILKAGQIRFFAPLLASKFIQQYLPHSPKSSYTITTGGVSERPMPNWSVIGSFAGGHHSMVRNLALDLKPIRVNGVSPGAVDTEMWKMEGQEKEKFMAECAKMTATGKVGRVEDIVESYLAVLRDGNMDGGVVRTDGGVLFS